MKIRFHSQLIRLSVVVLLTTLTTIFSIGQNIQSTKTIKIKGYTDTLTINLEYDSAIVSFSLRDVREQLTKAKAKKKFQSRDVQRYFSETLNDIKVDRDYLFKSNEDFAAGGIIEQYVLRTLISKGKSKVLNRTTNKYVDKIKRTHYRVSMAGESHEGYEFKFISGTIFLVDRISI